MDGTKVDFGHHNGKPITEDSDGYLMIWEPDHPNSFDSGWCLYHRWLMSEAIGRPLGTQEHVDHRDRNKHNNDLSNLQIMTGSSHGRKSRFEQRQDDHKTGAAAAIADLKSRGIEINDQVVQLVLEGLSSSKAG